jgi:probable F420-dependent oxidoreductase
VISIAVTLGTLNPRSWRDVALVADEVGVESVFVSDHVVAPVRAVGTLGRGGDESSRMNPSTPLYDSLGYLHYLAGITERIRLGTYVYLLGLRHPFVPARGFATLDRVSDGRALAGVGAGWLESEWDAVGISPRERGSRLDEAIDVCRLLWEADGAVEHQGAHFGFEPVGFEPKPLQAEGVPIHVGGASAAARRRAAVRGDGWMAIGHERRALPALIAEIRAMRAESPRADVPFSVTASGSVRDLDEALEWGAIGVDTVVVSPWRSSRSAAQDLRQFGREVLSRVVAS